MKIQCTVELGKDQTLNLTPDEAAAAVINALGGDEAVDYCIVYLVASQEPGTAGTPPEPPTLLQTIPPE